MLSILTDQIRNKQSFLCVGLDPVVEKLPVSLLSAADPMFEFCKRIIDATLPYAVAYKPNLAFFEANGSAGLASLERVIEYIPRECFAIADAKRGDIGNTAEAYARAFFERMEFNAVTLSPYMGADSIAPFLTRKGKMAIILAKTSNAGSNDFQMLELSTGRPLYLEVVAQCVSKWSPEQIMFVVGAQNAEELTQIRAIAPGYFFLIPGFGAQGGKLSDVSHILVPGEAGILANYSRQIIYASSGDDFDLKAGEKACEIAKEMAQLLADQI